MRPVGGLRNTGAMLEYKQTNEFVDAQFQMVDLRGAIFRDCDLRNVRLVSCAIDNLYISGFEGGMGTVVVNDVDVTDFVIAELARRHPERAQLEAMTSADEFRAMWDTVEGLWSSTIAHAGDLPETFLNERVDDEWSFIETLRHLVFAIDTWVGFVLKGEDAPYHPLGYPPTDSMDKAASMNLDVAARPSYAEVVALHAERTARMRAVVAAITDAQLDETRRAVLSADWGDETFPVRECLKIVMNESIEHRRFALRDLAVLEARLHSVQVEGRGT